MFVVNLSDGRTIKVDLTNEVQRSQWLESQDQSWFQEQITAVGIESNGRLSVLQRPTRFKTVSFQLELLTKGDVVAGEKATCQADDIATSIVAYVSQQGMVRHSTTRIGLQRFARPFRRS